MSNTTTERSSIDRAADVVTAIRQRNYGEARVRANMLLDQLIQEEQDRRVAYEAIRKIRGAIRPRGTRQ